MQAVEVQSTPVKDGRRVLGEKSANACQSPANQNVDNILKAGSATKRDLFKGSFLKRPSSPPFYAGQKRTIDKVEGNERNKSISEEDVQFPLPWNENQLQVNGRDSTAEEHSEVKFRTDSCKKRDPAERALTDTRC